MATATKILVAGDVRGQYDTLYARVGPIHEKKGPFSCLLCIGDFFGEPDAAQLALAPYLSGERSAPLPTYFVASSGLMPACMDGKGGGGEIAANLTCLGQAGTREIAGLQLAYASAADEEQASEQLLALRSAADAPGFRGVDVLLTHAWPRGAFRRLPEGALPAELLPDRDLDTVGLERLAELAALLRPRHHFVATEGQFYARPPYRLPDGHGAKLLAMAAVAADKKQRWLYALALAPLSATGGRPVEAEGTTDCPYPYEHVKDVKDERKRKRERVKDARDWVAQKCWFCMSSPNFEARLVGSINEEAYVSMAKGPLVSHHALVIPITHKSHSLELTEAESLEMRAYVSALRGSCAARGEALILFERYMGNSQFEHMHLQAVPLPVDRAELAKATFEQEGAKHGIRFEVLPADTPLSSTLAQPEPFLHVELPSGERLLHRLRSNEKKHPLQFGREVLARLLGQPRRADWKVCLPALAPGGPTIDEAEQQTTDAFKADFAPFDPTLVDGVS